MKSVIDMAFASCVVGVGISLIGMLIFVGIYQFVERDWILNLIPAFGGGVLLCMVGAVITGALVVLLSNEEKDE